MKTPLANAILENWNFDEEKKESLFNPLHKILKHEAFFDFMTHATKLMIAGDYDCDGVVSTTISVLLANKLGIETGYYIPNRLKEGYGVSKETIQSAYEKGYRDLLIVDNGVKANDEIDLAISLGFNVAVVDHHLIETALNEKAVWVHPDLIEDSYFSHMSAGGLMAALAEGMGHNDPYIEALGALATVADVMPLWGKNRSICDRGVQAINKHRFLQFESLVNARYLSHYTAQVLAFQISPKINTLGRLSDIANINTAVQYFCSDDPKVISAFATQVLSLNNQRKKMSKQIETLAFEKMDDKPVQVISDPNFHEGLLGIVANTIAHKSNKPSVLLKEYETIYKGSARSTSLSLQALFSHVPQEYFVNMGGHDFAFGLSLKKEYYESFLDILNTKALTLDTIEKEDVVLSVPIDWITKEALQEISQFEPLGEGIMLPKLKVKIPNDRTITPINGYGFKYRFQNIALKEAVLFDSSVLLEAFESAKEMIVSLDLQSSYGLQVYIEELI